MPTKRNTRANVEPAKIADTSDTGSSDDAGATINVVEIPKIVLVDDAGRQYYLEDRGRGTYLLRPMP